MTTRDEATQLVEHAAAGNAAALERLMPVVYNELRDLAGLWFRREPPGQTLQPTALVNAAYLKLLNHGRVDAAGATCFKGIAARAMQQVLIEHVRRRKAEKRGGDRERVPLAEAGAQLRMDEPDLADVTEALGRLRELDERQATIVELRFFGGLMNREVALAIGVSLSTVEADWRIARAWLRRELAEGSADSDETT